MPPALDVDYVRSRFPAFAEPSLRDWCFFENAGGSFACAPVIGRLERYYRATKVQPYGPYPASRDAGEQMDHATMRMAAMLNIPAEELCIGPSTSQNTHVLARAFAGILNAGDEIIVTNQDHEANSGCWRRLAEMGVVVHEWRIDPESGQLRIADLENLLGPRTRLVAFPHCSNIVGQINDVAAISLRVHEAGALAVADGVSYAPHGLPDVAAAGADVYLFSTYKTYGPHQGIMVVRRNLLRRLPNQGHWFNEADLGKRLIPAGPDHAQVAACAGIADYMDDLYAHHHGAGETVDAARRCRAVGEMFRRHETALLEPLLEYLAATGKARIIGSGKADGRAPTVALDTIRAPERICADLAELGIMAGAGHFYAVRTLQGLGIDPERGVLRLSFVHYTSEREIDQLIAALETVL